MDVRIEIGGQHFVWDDAKAEANAAKHGVLRLISARRATRDEENRYAE